MNYQYRSSRIVTECEGDVYLIAKGVVAPVPTTAGGWGQQAKKKNYRKMPLSVQRATPAG
jgi:hypothetical protein